MREQPLGVLHSISPRGLHENMTRSWRVMEDAHLKIPKHFQPDGCMHPKLPDSTVRLFFSQQHLRCLGSRLVSFSAGGRTGRERDGSDDRVDGRETVGNSLGRARFKKSEAEVWTPWTDLGRASLGGGEMEAWTSWTDGRGWEIAWGELGWEEATY